MARDIQQRLKSLEARRRGTDRRGMTFDAADQVLAKSLAQESYQVRGANKEFTKYALGSMQAVDPEYTRIGIEEATRVGKQLESGLAKLGIDVEFRLQGSVPCDIHIRGASDVDLLVLEGRYIRYEVDGPKAKRGEYRNPVSYNTLTIYGISVTSFALSSLAFLIAKPWNHLWWLAHAIFATGFFLLSYGVVRAFQTTHSFSTIYSQEELMARLAEAKVRTEEALHQLQAAHTKLEQLPVATGARTPIVIDDSAIRAAPAIFGCNWLRVVDTNQA